jgi:hypothetical protein
MTDLLLVLVTALHLGSLHAYEKALVALVAFGPFVVLFGVVYVVRRRDVQSGGDD